VNPFWLEVVGWVSLGVAFASALAILVDELLLGQRQAMGVMNLVHPITALYWGPVWLVAYFTRGRRMSRKAMHDRVEELEREGADPEALRAEDEAAGIRPWQIANAVSHCGAGCTLGDIGGEWIVWATGWSIAGVTVWPELLLDFPLAWGLGILFQYFTIVPMREDVGRLQGLWLAVRADTLSILSFEVGLFGWMVLSAKVLWQPPLEIDTPGHWLMMQLGMIVGYFTSWPVNRWLVARGWKEKMSSQAHAAEMLESARAESA
jgi:Domain of unknown function (DUF4396)